MYRRIIELYALSDTDRPRTDDDNPLFTAPRDKGLGLVVIRLVIGRIEIRGTRGKFSRARIDHLEYGLSVIGNFTARQRRDILVEITEFFTPLINLARNLSFRFFDLVKFGFIIDEMFKFMQKPPVDFRNRKNRIFGNTTL